MPRPCDTGRVPTISIEQAPAWVGRLEGELQKAALRGLYSAAQRMVGVVGEVIAAEPRIPVDRGIYKAGWRARRLPDGAEISNSTPHAGFIEDGVRADRVRPGRAMIDALAAWVARKGLTGSARGVERAAEARRIAWAIAKSMQKNGIFNRGGGLKIFEKARQRLPALIEEEVRREIGRMAAK
jgi:hypothetical protein